MESLTNIFNFLMTLDRLALITTEDYMYFEDVIQEREWDNRQICLRVETVLKKLEIGRKRRRDFLYGCNK